MRCRRMVAAARDALPSATSPPGLVKQPIPVLRPPDPRETGFAQMHAGDQQPVRTDALQNPRPRGGGHGPILIERDRYVRPPNLDVRKMHHVAPYEQSLIAGLEHITGMPVGMPGQRHRVDAGKHLPAVEGAQRVAIGVEYEQGRLVAPWPDGSAITKTFCLVLPEPLELAGEPLRAFAKWIVGEARG